MNIDRTGFAIGVLTGFVLFVNVAVFADWRGIGSAELCAANEPILACGREWINVAAVIAGAATVLFILFQMRVTDRHHRENMMLQTLEMRTTISSVIHKYILPVERVTQGFVRQAKKFQVKEMESFRAEYILDNIPRLEERISEAADQLKNIDDGRIHVAATSAIEHLKLLRSDWTRPVELFNTGPVKNISEDMIDELNFVIVELVHFTNEVRKLHEEVSPGSPPIIQELAPLKAK